MEKHNYNAYLQVAKYGNLVSLQKMEKMICLNIIDSQQGSDYIKTIRKTKSQNLPSSLQ